MNKMSLPYRFLRALLKIALNCFYKNIKLEGNWKQAQEGPLIIAANHPNSFLDAILISCYLNRPLHFLARSDVFKQKWADRILRKMHLIPVYRLQEGKENMHKNAATFLEAEKLLEKNGALIIFVEGVSIPDRQLKPIKKGLCRIAFGFEEKQQFSAGTQVLPIGIFYEDIPRFHTRIILSAGRKLNIADYQKKWDQNENKAFQAFNDNLRLELEMVTLRSIRMNEFDLAINQIPDKKFTLDNLKNLAEKIDLNKTEEINPNIKPKSSFWKNVAFFPLRIVNVAPFWMARILSKNLVKDIEFFCSVYLCLGTVLWGLWSLILAVAFGQLFHPIGYLTPFLLFLLGKIYLRIR